MPRFMLSALVLWLLAVTTAAQAGPKLYTGTLVFQGFGNSIVQTVTPMGMAETRYSYLEVTTYAVPLGVFCNYNYPTMYVSMGKVFTGPLFISTVYPAPRSQYAQYCARQPTFTMGKPFVGSGTASTLTMVPTPSGSLTFNQSSAAIVLPGGVVYDSISGSFGSNCVICVTSRVDPSV